MERRTRGESMDTQKPITHLSSPTLSEHEVFKEFKPGTSVIYGIHGKCQLVAIESRNINGTTIQFYKLELQKSSLSRSNRKDPAIWIPIHSAKEQGLRAPINSNQVESIFKILLSREFYFELTIPWSIIHERLESVIRKEGAVGLAKVASYLFVLKRKQITSTQDIAKFQETVNRLLLRELSEVTGESIRTLEDKIARGFKQKIRPEN